MRQIKLTPFKRILLMLLCVFVGYSYDLKVNAYVLMQAYKQNGSYPSYACDTTTASYASAACTGYSLGMFLKNVGNSGLVILSNNQDLYQWYTQENTANSSGICICFTKSELAKIQSCNANYGSCGAGATGTTMHILLAGRNSTGDQHISCGAYKASCTCTPGYYAITNGCTPCTAGYYCSKATMVQYTYAAGGSTACPKGTYQGNSGMISCNACGSLNGLTATTSGTGKTKVTDCYLPSNSNLTDSIGTYQFTGNCYAIAS